MLRETRSDTQSVLTMNLQEKMHVLVVDDEEKDRRNSTAILTQCIPDVEIEYATDYDSALPMLLHEYFDFAMLDLVLHHEPIGSSEGWEGTWLLQDLVEKKLNGHIPIIILTGFGDKNLNVIVALFKDFAVTEVWTKTQPIDTLAGKLHTVLEKLRYFGLACEVEFSNPKMNWGTMIGSMGLSRRLSNPVSPEVAQQELKHILRKLFFDRSRIVVSPLGAFNDEGHSGAGVCVVTPFGGQGSHEADLIVKYGTLDQIAQEINGWDNLRNYMQHYRMTQRGSYVFGRELGILAYSLVGAESGKVKPFSQFYGQGAGVEDILKVLKTLFERNFALCFAPENRLNPEKYDLQDCYSRYLGFNSETVLQAFAFKYPEMPIGQKMIRFDSVPRLLPHPIAAFSQDKARFVMETWMCRTHGDLHTGNILVDTDLKEPWLIDFGRAGIGHWARDLVALEASIKFQHIPTKELGDLFDFESALIQPDNFAEPINYFRPDQPELNKAAAVISELRRIAGLIDKTPTAARSYYAALYYQTLNYVRLHKLIKNSRRKNHVLLATALIYEKLSRDSNIQ